MSGVFPIDPHTPSPEHGPSYISGSPATVRDAPPGFKAAAGTMLEARVLGRDSAGRLILRTTNGVLAIATGAQPPTGSTVTLHFRAVGASVQAYIVGVHDDGSGRRREPKDESHARLDATAPVPQRERGGTQAQMAAEGTAALTRIWPALEEALAALHGNRGADPAGLHALLARLPQPGESLGSRLMFYLAALTRGEVRAWLGEPPFDALARAGRDDLIERITADFDHLVRFAAEPVDDWRLYVLPVFLDGHIHQLRIFVHSPPTSQARDNAHRVVAEMHLPHLGDVQLDSLLRRHRLDMILRSRAPLGEADAARVRDLVARATAWGRVGGDITLAPGQQWQFLALPGHSDRPHGVMV